MQTNTGSCGFSYCFILNLIKPVKNTFKVCLAYATACIRNGYREGPFIFLCTIFMD